MDLITKYNEKKEVIKKRLDDFSKIENDEDLFYELCFCILTPQSKAKLCWKAIEDLKKNDFLHKEINPLPFLLGRSRFQNNKTKYLIEAKEKYNEIIYNLRKLNAFEMREWLIENIKGISYKESGHFLRNIGRRDLAILDRHILKNLLEQKVISEIPKTLTKKKYLEIENKFKEFSNKLNIPMDELDLLFWSKEEGTVFK
ncbi:MAG: N-glycosylase/DNA lyase [Nanoarchaeota archaeon]